MATIWVSFRDCGSASYLILLLGILGFVGGAAAAIILLTSKHRTFSIIAAATPLVIGVAIFAVGELGKVSGEARVESALAGLSTSDVSTEEREEIRVQGHQEAAQCVSIGIGGGTLPVIFGLVLLPIALFKKKSEAPENQPVTPSRNQKA